MSRRVRAMSDSGLRPRQEKKNSSTIIALIVFVLLALLLLIRSRQTAIPEQQPASVKH